MNFWLRGRHVQLLWWGRDVYHVDCSIFRWWAFGPVEVRVFTKEMSEVSKKWAKP